MIQYLRIIKDIDYNRNQSEKVWPTIFFKKGNIYGRKNSVGYGLCFPYKYFVIATPDKLACS